MGIKFNGMCCGRNWFLDSITGVNPIGYEEPDPLEGMEFILTFTDLGTLPTGITAWDSLAEWNTLLVSTGTAFTSILVDTDTFRVGLAGGSGITTGNGQFANTLQNNNQLVSVEDTVGCIISLNEQFAMNCPNLSWVSFPGVTTISSNAFAECTALTAVTAPVVDTLHIQAFMNCSSLLSVSFPLCTLAGGSTFDGCTSLVTAIVPLLTQITERLFYSCSSLTAFSALGVTDIQRNAFYGCTSLASVAFPVVLTIGDNAFENTSSLTAVTFDDLTTIGVQTFKGSAIQYITFPSVTSVGGGAFQNTGLITISLPVCTTAGAGLFGNSTSLEEVYMDVVSGLPSFYGCSSLVVIYLPIGFDSDGGTDNQYFFGIIGNTITATMNTALQTNNAGGPDLDIVYLNSNNTVSFTWI